MWKVKDKTISFHSVGLGLHRRFVLLVDLFKGGGGGEKSTNKHKKKKDFKKLSDYCEERLALSNMITKSKMMDYDDDDVAKQCKSVKENADAVKEEKKVIKIAENEKKKKNDKNKNNNKKKKKQDNKENQYLLRVTYKKWKLKIMTKSKELFRFPWRKPKFTKYF